jgi:hypothetical protein
VFSESLNTIWDEEIGLVSRSRLSQTGDAETLFAHRSEAFQGFTLERSNLSPTLERNQRWLFGTVFFAAKNIVQYTKSEGIAVIRMGQSRRKNDLVDRSACPQRVRQSSG